MDEQIEFLRRLRDRLDTMDPAFLQGVGFAVMGELLDAMCSTPPLWRFLKYRRHVSFQEELRETLEAVTDELAERSDG